jgi:hypothetical protein
MSQTDFFSAGPAVLYSSAWYSATEREVRPLPLGIGDYKVTPGHGAERWKVTCLKTNEVIYDGIGPVEIRHPPAAG